MTEDYQHDKEFHLAVGRNALLKSKILSVFFGAVVVVQIVVFTLVNFLDVPFIKNLPLEKVFFVPLVLMVIFAGQLFSYFHISKAIKKGEQFSIRTGYVVGFLEVSLPSVLVYLIGKYFPQEGLMSRDILMGGPPIFLYIFFIIISALLLDFKLSVFMGGVACVEYVFLIFFLIGENLEGIDIPLTVFKGVAFLVCGIISGLVSLKIKESVLASMKAKNDLIYNLDKMVKEQTKEIRGQKEEIERKNKDITDSINYAKKIQQAILPATDMIFKTLTDSFIFYKPKDIVSGDFYFFAQKDDTVLIGACDCTGHGVPGAFMSMIGHEQLNKIVIEKGITEPKKILTELNIGVKNILKQSGGDDESRDGMDISLVSLQFANNNLQIGNCKLEFAGANRPLFLFRNNILEEIKADKIALGGLTPNNFIFHQHSFDLKKGDTLYIFTDGFTDQFGGEQKKKFTSKKFRELLLSIQNKSMKEQEMILKTTIEIWMGDLEQVDDILVMGVRI